MKKEQKKTNRNRGGRRDKGRKRGEKTAMASIPANHISGRAEGGESVVVRECDEEGAMRVATSVGL